MKYDHKTIFAPATHPGKAGVAIIRISGGNAKDIFGKLCKIQQASPRIATVTPIVNPITHQLIDHSIVIWFPRPHSFTGEDTVELHIHGSIAIINSVMDILATFSNYRVALPGEFARRAFFNGKMDLTKAEGLADLIDAETSLQQRQALRQMSGQLEKLYELWRCKIITILANIEAYIDFPDEEIPEEVINEVTSELAILSKEIDKHLNDNHQGEKLRSGVYITIIGKPNVGKSTLLNHLAKRDVAIVSHIAGTTRDIIEVHLDIAGVPITIADTAGIRESADEVEIEGIRRTLERNKMADFNIIMFDCNDQQIDQQTLALLNENTICLINKIDLATENNFALKEAKNPLFISLKTGAGIEQFITLLELRAKTLISPSSDPVITRARYRNHLQKCVDNLRHFSLNNDLELAAEDLRLAARELGQITGIIDIDTILDEIFSNFCIGK